MSSFYFFIFKLYLSVIFSVVRGLKLLLTTPLNSLFQAIDWAISIAQALVDLHNNSRGYSVIHRDVKKENVLLHMTNDGNLLAKLCDFGLSAVRDYLWLADTIV